MATVTDTQQIEDSLLSTLLSDETTFWPAQPRSVEETGLRATDIESLVCKFVAAQGTTSGRTIAEKTCLPFGIIESVLGGLRARQILVHAGTAPFNDYYYGLTDQGRRQAESFRRACAYIGPAPVPLDDYVMAVEAQTINAEATRRDKLAAAFRDITVEAGLVDALGPAVNSGAGMFLYGEPGNGKSTLARRITHCFGQEIWIPHTLMDDGQIIKLHDSSYHRQMNSANGGIVKSQDHDARWVRIRRPTVVVGGELTMDSLEIRHDRSTNISEAPLQMKSNCGCLLIDDFGRQRIAPAELLNRWIIPLENRHDYLTLATGKKIQVPFEQLIIFSTNLDPSDLVDEAFLRRIPYKIEVRDPSVDEFHHLFKLYAKSFGCEYHQSAVDHLLETHYKPTNRALRRCHPRDLLSLIRNFCTYYSLPMELKPEYIDRVIGSYFTSVLQPKKPSPTSN